MRSRQSLITMSPELLQKLEAASQNIDQANHANNLVNVLEKRIDSSKEIYMVDPKNVNDSAVETTAPINSPTPEKADETDQFYIVTSESSTDFDTRSVRSEGDKEDFVCDLFDVSVEVSEKRASTQSLISTTTNTGNKRDSLEAPPSVKQRRASRWSATVLFLASDVQLTVNLAEFAPPDGSMTAPKRVSYILIKT